MKLLKAWLQRLSQLNDKQLQEIKERIDFWQYGIKK